MGTTASRIGSFFNSFDQRGLNTLPRNSRILAWFSDKAYSKQPPPTHQGYLLIENLPTIKVWRNDETKTIVIAVRGTDFDAEANDYDDLKTDLQLVMNGEEQTQRFKTAELITRKTISRFPGYKIVITGHSLGGGIAYRLADKYKKLTGEVFNPAVNTRTLRDVNNTTRRIKTHIIDGDPVSGILGRPLPNTQVYTPAYGEEAIKLKKKPIHERMIYLHNVSTFPQI